MYDKHSHLGVIWPLQSPFCSSAVTSDEHSGRSGSGVAVRK